MGRVGRYRLFLRGTDAQPHCHAGTLRLLAEEVRYAVERRYNWVVMDGGKKYHTEVPRDTVLRVCGVE